MMWETILSNLMGTGVFIIVLSILIIVHEFGHFMTARKVGVRVETFSIGFGKKIYKKVIDGTEFCISLIPLGGYVKMAGDERSECNGNSDEFYSKTPGQRALVALNGPVVNFILAYICLVVVFLIGYPDFSTKVGELIEDYPAVSAGLIVGDEILTVNDVEVNSWSGLKKEITSEEYEIVHLLVLRNNNKIKLSITPQVQEQENIFGQKKQTRLIGIIPDEEIVSIRYGIGESLVRGFTKIGEITAVTYKSIYFMVTGSMSPKNMAGPVMIFKIIKDAAATGINHLIFIMGVISASLAIFNLLPIIPLDGGHLLLLGIEKLRGKPLSEKADNFIAQAGFILIICLALFVFYNDFEKIGLIDKIKSIFGK